MNSIKSFFQETKLEFKRINWPQFSETRNLTLIVIGLSLGMALFLGLLDYVFAYILSNFIL